MSIPMGPLPRDDDLDHPLAGFNRRMQAKGYAVYAFTEEQVIELLAWHSECGPYCVGDEHSDLAFLAVSDDQPADEDLVENTMRALYPEQFGVEYLRHRREPRYDGADAGYRDFSAGSFTPETGDLELFATRPGYIAQLTHRAYRAWFRCPVPLDLLRAKFGIVADPERPH